MPLITKYGRRVCYVFTFGFCTLCILWAGLATDFQGELVARLGVRSEIHSDCAAADILV